MKNDAVFIPISINKAEPLLVADYGYYCDDKVSMNEMPFSFQEWQIANYEMAD